MKPIWLEINRFRFETLLGVLVAPLALFCLPLLANSPKITLPEIATTPKVFSLAEAVRHIAEKASLDLVFADNLLNGMNVVFHPGDDLNLDHLDQVLNGTDITYKVNQAQRLVLYRNKDVAARRVAGYVVSARGGGAIVGAQVTVPGSQRTALTDVTGAFTMKGVPQAFDKIEVSAKGLTSRLLDLEPAGDTQMVIILSHAMEMSENLRVYAPKRTRLQISPLTGQWSLTSDESYQEGPPGWDLFDSLKELPGVNAGTGESGLEFRGGQPSENLVLLDGIQLFQFDHALGAFSALNADAIGQIEVFKGGYPANYGDRLSGVLSLETRQDMFDTSEIRFGVDRDKADLTFLAPLGSKLAIMVSARSSINQDISASTVDRNYESTFNRENFVNQQITGVFFDRDIGFSDFIGKVAFRPTLSDAVNLTVYTGEDDVGESMRHQGLFDLSYAQDGVLRNEGLSFSWDRVWSPNFETQARTTVSRYESNFATREIDWNDLNRRFNETFTVPALPYAYLDSSINTRLETKDTEFEGIWQVSLNHQIRFGLSESEKSISSFEEGYYLSSPLEDVQKTKLRSTYIQDQWQMGTWFSALLGIRFADNTLSNTTFSEPRLSFKLQGPDRPWSLRGSWGEYHQHLLRSPDNLNYFAGIETWFLAYDALQPGKSQQAQFGGSWKYHNWNFDFEFFRREQRGSLFRIFEPVRRGFFVHQSKDRIQGLDMLIHQKRGSFSTFLGYSYQDAEVIEDVTYGIPLSHPTDRNRPHQLHLAFNYSRGPWRTVLAWRYASGLPYSVPEIGMVEDSEGELVTRLVPSDATNNFRLPDTHQLDARVQYSFGWSRIHGNLGLYLFNIYDRNNPLNRYYRLDDDNILPVDVPGFKFRPSIRLQFVY